MADAGVDADLTVAVEAEVAEAVAVVLLTNKLHYTRDREPLTEVRNAFRATAFP